MPEQFITVKGAREHNLKNIDVQIPRNSLTVVTGLSGSGKSTLAFDTIYAEGQRRYVESLSSYARQFLGVMDKPDVDSIDGLSPAISIDQKGAGRNPRSTVGTVTEVYDYLRLLYARIGIPHCVNCGQAIRGMGAEQIAQTVAASAAGKKVQVLSPLVRGKKGTYERLFQEQYEKGIVRFRVDGKEFIMDDDKKVPGLGRYDKHNIEAVIDRITLEAGPKWKEGGKDTKEIDNTTADAAGIRHDSKTSDSSTSAYDEERTRLQEAIETALKNGEAAGIVIILTEEGRGKVNERLFSTQNSCPDCGTSFEKIEPRIFSFNSPFGACAECHGLGVKSEFDPELVIPDRKKTLLEGAIVPWGGMFKSFRMQALAAVGKKFGFDLTTPVEKFDRKQMGVILNGTEQTIQYRHVSGDGSSRWEHEGKFEGVVPNLTRLLAETKSDYRREELKRFMRDSTCPECNGDRLKKEPLAVKVAGRNIVEASSLSISESKKFFSQLESSLTEKEKAIAKLILKEIVARLEFLDNVGLSYLTLGREAGTLSGGEAQRIRLATQIGSGLTGVLYVLDEPSIGLHQRDNRKLLSTLKRLRDLGNTLIVVEHDEETMREADYMLDLGPGAGVHGGKVVAAGTPGEIERAKDSITGAYLRGEKKIEIPKQRRMRGKYLKVVGARGNNLKNVTVHFPTGSLTCVTGVSGSGKSTLVIETLQAALAQKFFFSKGRPLAHERIEGLDGIESVVAIDQSPIGRTPRSNPATYIGAFSPIRELFAMTPEARARGYAPGRFSFNVAQGRCSACEGDGLIRIEMHFLPDVYVQCESCKGRRYDESTLSIRFKGRNIADVLEMSVEEALAFFENVPAVRRKLSCLNDVGLGYAKLGQASTTLSGGEAQRIKLAAELGKTESGKTVYILDEPTTGLHFDDVRKLLDVLHRLAGKGNTVIVIEHNLDVIKTADYVVDIGPEGGDAGGRIIAEGTPEEVAANPKSATGAYLNKALRK
ncbi:excinuclease ABC subunit UvrA [Candidatus Micrarchaeota archaeon]|nr:excinuclease ABC subunit UvrA [Candidatus Micrarchaeota archaeon]